MARIQNCRTFLRLAQVKKTEQENIQLRDYPPGALEQNPYVTCTDNQLGYPSAPDS